MNKHIGLKIFSLIIIILVLVFIYVYYKISQQGFHYMNEVSS